MFEELVRLEAKEKKNAHLLVNVVGIPCYCEIVRIDLKVYDIPFL